MELFLIYLWLRINALLFLCVAVLVLTGLIVIFVPVALIDCDEALTKKLWKYLRRLAWFGVLPAVLTLLFVPNKTDVAILVGSHYALKAAETPEAAKVMTLLRKKANELLDKAIAEEKK